MKYKNKNFKISLCDSVLLLFLVISFVLGGFFLNSYSSTKSKYNIEQTAVDFIIPSPSDNQVESIKNLDHVTSVIPYGFAAKSVSKQGQPIKTNIFIIDDVKESYLGLINGQTVIALMSDEDGNSIPNVFYDNVRDYQGENRVNIEIQSTLKEDYKNSFSILNNGITIVAEELDTTRNDFTITNYQIINGCQTANVLFHNKELVDEKIQVSLKLIISNNQDVISRVIRSTNSQTEIKAQDLLAYSNFQKRLEDYYNTFSGQNRLYYERRSKQYNSTSIERSRIIDKTLQIKVLGSFFFDKPNLATRYFGTLFSEFKDSIFKDSDNFIPYYTAAYIFI